MAPAAEPSWAGLNTTTRVKPTWVDAETTTPKRRRDDKETTMVRQIGTALVQVLLTVAVAAGTLGCEGPGRANVSVRQSELSDPGQTLSAAPLDLQVLSNSCGANQAQDFFKIVNNGTTSVKASDLTIKLWVNDTSGSAVVPHVSTGGCLTNAGGCFHPLTGVTVSPAQLPAACGPDPAHQANWEITISTTDTTALAPGVTWNNLQSALNLANFTNFTPGSSSWYSPCVPGTSYTSDPHFALYLKGVLVASSGVNAPACRAPHGAQQLSGFATPPKSTAPFVGPVPATTVLELAVALPLRDAPGLHAFAQQASDPHSPSYGQSLTNAQFMTTYAPSSANYQAAVAWAQTNGLTIVRQYPSQTLLDVRGNAATINKALFANLIFRHRPDGTTFFMLDREPSISLPVTVKVGWIDGLNNYILPARSAGSGVGAAFLGDDFRNAYASCAPTITGTGQCVGIFALGGGFNPADIASYQSAAKRTTPVPVNVSGTTQDATNDTAFEVSMDIEMALSMAPGLSEVVVFEGGNPLSILTDMGSRQPTCLQLSDSIEFDFPSSMYQEAVDVLVSKNRQTLFQSSGDDGSYSNSPTNSVAFDNTTLVGGTTLAMNGAGASWASEIVWDVGVGSISGGGVVDFLPLPSYQMAILDLAALGGSTTNRNAPDVAAVANNVEVFGPFGTPPSSGPWISGGTSASSPLWAGFMALVNQQRLAGGNNAIGFANPALYGVAANPALYPLTFNDVTSGTNGQFDAASGYDLTTGLGSPQCNLIYQLSSTSPTTPVPNTTLHVTGSATVTVTDLSGHTASLTQTLDQSIPFNMTTRDGGFDLFVRGTGVNAAGADAGAAYVLAPNNVDLITVGQGFRLGPIFVDQPGPTIPAGSSTVFTGSEGVGFIAGSFESAAISWSFTLQSSQQP
jgi:xanthomonalisin